MKESFESHPDVIEFNATYKLLKIRRAVYIMVGFDGVGCSTIVGIGILEEESRESLTWLLETFKKVNPS